MLLQPLKPFPELSRPSREILEHGIREAEAAYESGEALGEPATALAGFEIEYRLHDEKNQLEKLTDRKYRQIFGRPRRDVERDRELLLTNGREQVRQTLNALSPTTDEEVARQAHWLTQVDDLTLPELVTYLAYQELSQATLAPPRGPAHNTETAPIVEFRFGPDIYQRGYYDNKGVFEIRTTPRSPTEAQQASARTVETLQRYAKQYGLDFATINCHPNFSVYGADGQLLHDLLRPEGAEIARRATTRMLLAIRDVSPLMLPVAPFQDGIISYGAQSGRTSFMRVLADRFEARQTKFRWDAEDAVLLAMMAGFARGYRGDLELSAEDAWAEATIVERPAYRRTADFDPHTDLHILRAIQHSQIAADGSLRLQTAYANERHGPIFQAFFGSAMDNVEYSTSGSDVDDFIRTLRVTPEHQLYFDDLALKDWWGSLSDKKKQAITAATVHADGVRIGLLEARLEKVEFAGMMATIQVPEMQERTSLQTWPQVLKRMVGSQALGRFIETKSRQRLADELTSVMSSR